MITTTIELRPEFFSSIETPFLQAGGLSASLFRFSSGVCAVRLTNELGSLLLLPFQGQQIWSANLCGRELTMKSMFDQPYPTHDFLATYGAFLLHCGATAMGVPGPEDSHPLHGELPNALYQSAALQLGEDEKGTYLALTGVYTHTMAFNYHYQAQPMTQLYAGSSVFSVSMTVTNLKQTRMPLMYLTHINFRPVNYGRLVYSAECTSAHMRVRAEVPAFMETPPGYREFIQMLKDHPEKHLILDPQQVYNPEVVFFVDYLAGQDGWARAMQVHPDGSADVVRHRPDQLAHALRWICRTPDQDALGFEPATAEGTGFTSELKKGNLIDLDAQQQFHCDLEIGVLNKVQTQQEEILIQQAVAR